MPPPVATGKSSHLPQATGGELENSGDSVSVSPESKGEPAADDEQKTSPEAVQHLEPESLQGHAASSPTVETGTVICKDKQLQRYFNAASFLIFILCSKALFMLELPCRMFQVELSVGCWIFGSGISYHYRALVCTLSLYLTFPVPQFLFQYCDMEFHALKSFETLTKRFFFFF